jgi:hypothetical protein
MKGGGLVVMMHGIWFSSFSWDFLYALVVVFLIVRITVLYAVSLGSYFLIMSFSHNVFCRNNAICDEGQIR